MNMLKWLGVVVLMVLLSSTLAAQDDPPSEYVKAISPDGTQMVVASYPDTNANSADQSLFLMDMSGQVLYPLFAGHYVTSAEWSPDGTKLAMVTVNEANDAYTLCMVDPETGEARSVSENIPYHYSMSWSPDGQWLLMEGNTYIFYVWEEATGELMTIMEEPYYIRAFWSANSQYIMFIGRDDDLHAKIFVYDTHEKRLSDNLLQSYWFPKGSAGDIDATLSPDSQQIAFAIHGDANIYLIDIASETFRPFVHTGGQIKMLDWSADGTGLYFQFEAFDYNTGEIIQSAPLRGLYQVALADATITPVRIGRVEYIEFAADHQHFLAYGVYEDDGETVLYRLGIGDAANGTILPIELDYVQVETYRWTQDGTQFAVSICTSAEHDYDVYHFDVVTHEMTLVTQDGASDAPNCGALG